ncbi:MAG: glycosyltransferase family 4 protein [Nanoarchaeota archaeon]
MKIAHVSMFFLPTFGGVEQTVYELATRQIAQGHEVHVFCCDSDKNKRIEMKEEIIDGIHVHRIPYIFRMSFNTFIWPSLLFKLNRNFDVIHTHVSGHMHVFISGIISMLSGARHVHTTHCPWTGMEFRPFILRPFISLNELFLNKISFSMVDRIVAITPWEIRTIERFANNKKIVTLPTGVDSMFYKKILKNNFRKNNKIVQKKFVLFFGRMSKLKGPEKLALAAINISKKRNDVFFAWIGPDEGMAEEVEGLIKNYPNMKYFGPIRGKEKIAEMYQSADVYVLPSYREGLPLTLFEAMASGLPIVVSPVNGIPYEINDGENGFFVEYGDVENLEKKILKILDDKRLAKIISKNNIKKSRNYDWDLIYGKYMEYYRADL